MQRLGERPLPHSKQEAAPGQAWPGIEQSLSMKAKGHGWECLSALLLSDSAVSILPPEVWIVSASFSARGGYHDIPGMGVVVATFGSPW